MHGVGRPYQFTNQSQHAALPTLRAYFMVATVKQQGTDTVTVLDSGPTNQGSRTRRNHRLEGTPGCEKHTRAEINHDHDRALAFFLIEFYMGATGARRDTPVHTANIIAGLIGP